MEINYSTVYNNFMTFVLTFLLEAHNSWILLGNI